MCHEEKQKVTCKNETEIKKWMIGRYFMLITNQKRFIEHKFEDGKIQAKSVLVWYPLNATGRTDYVQKIERTEINLYDNYYSVGEIWKELDLGFQENRMPNRELPYRNLF